MCHYVRQRIRSDWDLETIVKDYFAIETELAHRQFEREREITMEALRAEAGRGLPPTHRLPWRSAFLARLGSLFVPRVCGATPGTMPGRRGRSIEGSSAASA